MKLEKAQADYGQMEPKKIQISYISFSMFPSCSSQVRKVLWLIPQQ